MEDELTIIRSAQKGDEEAWNILVKRYSKVIWSATRSYTLSSEDREDIVQEVFLKLVHGISKYNPEKASFSTFVTIIAKRTTIDKVRKIIRRREDIIPPEDLAKLLAKLSLPSTKDPSSEEVEEMIDSLRKALNEKLTAEQRLAIELRYFKKCTHPQIARIMNRDMHWVKNTLSRTKAKLRQILLNKIKGKKN